MEAKKLMMLALLAFSMTLAKAQGITDKLTVALSKPGQPYELSVSLIHGSITVEDYDGTEIQIQTSGGKIAKPEMVNGMRRIGGGGSSSNIVAEENGNKVKINTGMPGGVTGLNLKIPHNISRLKLVTVNSGSLNVTDVNADIEVTNTNGSIRLNNVSGSVVATTVNGSVAATLKSADSKAAMAFTTLNGNVDVSLPAGIRSSIKAKTDHGSVSTDFDMKATSGSTTQSDGADGMRRLKSDNWIYGSINGGGQEILLKTLNGNIIIRKAK